MSVPIPRRVALAAAAAPLLAARPSAGGGENGGDDESTSGGGPLAGARADHVMINVADFDRGLAWYTGTLGFSEVVRWTVAGLAGTRLAYLEKNGFKIELTGGPTTPATAKLPDPADFAAHFTQRGITHLCFAVPDVDAALAEVNRRGTPTFSPPIDFPPLGLRVGFVKDPFGNVIEFKGPPADDNPVPGEATWAAGKGPADL